ncbi:glycoside hydrolase family 127 protein [Tessaracoccus rhinocerotis]|uniref:Glycoside hydrolase family 127 protein n=1 Tax=Tessaracoccus rhinocerotis TaxID=1689449 RepID=A0A553JX38_9ACTN|nr:beta-L-arabinofuranosidase domain-containing protein [Tessaracoccus rhinocerotis]TRY17004.1 glycoside hydrolase family 127 protein [Tessaracoccus rhinocerotis]
MHTSPVPVAPSNGVLQPIAIDRIVIDGGFWGERQQLNADAIIPHCLKWETKAGWVENFVHTLEGTIHEHRQGREFADSDVYKLIEAMAWEAGRSDDAELDAEIERLGAMIKAVQREDGYLNTNFDNPGQQPRYTDFEWGHELYNYGHLIQAAVARIRTGRADSVIVDVATRVADHVVAEFGAGANEKICGHPEIEVALAEFARATGDERYLEQASLFIERRGHDLLADIEWGRSYYQDDQPYRDAEVLVGHSVRALYLTSAAIDVAVEKGDVELLEIAKRQYDNALARRTYITGGMGSHHQDEAFGDDFELPPDRSYCETCAGIGSVMVAWRLLLATGDITYGDAIERALYNIVATSTAEDGQGFFYSNTLHRRTPAEVALPDVQVPRANSSLRAPWFDVSCCPTNVARTFATLAGYLAARTDDGVALVQYAPTTLDVDGIGLKVETAYPYEGEVNIRVTAAAEPFVLTLRIPAWAAGATVNGESAEPGVFRLEGVTAGDEVQLVLPLQPRLVRPDARIDAIRGTVAVERGPLVLCAESVDLPEGMTVNELVVDPSGELRAHGAGAVLPGARIAVAEDDWPYAAAPSAEVGETFDVPLVPYHSWANRGPATMRVWLPVA